MCRLFSLTSTEPMSPMKAIEALDMMKEGHDGSGIGLFLSDLDGPFSKFKDLPILSGIFTRDGLRRLEEFMSGQGFIPKHMLTLDAKNDPPPGTPRRETYLVQVYEPPASWQYLDQSVQEKKLTGIRLKLRHMGEAEGDMVVFSFWPDVIMIKEVGDPMEIGTYLGLDREEIYARRILAQGRQNTNYGINLYACHPFFIQGVSTMTNGENTAFVPIKEYLSSQGVVGYEGYQSDSEVFTHILHFTLKELGLGIEAYKHVITPLQESDLAAHPDRDFLHKLRQSCRRLIIDGPNCVIGCLPDKTMFMVQDRKKLRPGIVGGRSGLFAFSSEACGLDAVVPDRDKTKDFQPMHLDTVIVSPDCKEVRTCRQTQPLPLQH
ncbi:glutamate synthase [Desulfonatronovibrio hydrogenovorans]|uniref:glutamate synthase n=1 Tax=Desulfonatronovibrio hydrogenovorans TaxID=53245 RepID=UPI00048E8DA5|nr:glutamate synthase [Desulfonatronovibrio hydrogenovorans]